MSNLSPKCAPKRTSKVLTISLPRRSSGGSLAMFAAIREARSDSQLCETLSNTPDQSQNDQQDNRADEGVDDCGNNTAAD
jgi:hypothetical protein